MKTECPNCKNLLNCPDEYEGRKVKCKKCNESFVANPYFSQNADNIVLKDANNNDCEISKSQSILLAMIITFAISSVVGFFIGAMLNKNAVGKYKEQVLINKEQTNLINEHTRTIDKYETQVNNLERQIADIQESRKQTELALKNEIIAEQEKARVTQEKARAEQEQEKAEQEKARSEQKRKEVEEKQAAARKVYNTGETVSVGYTSYCVWKSFWSQRLSNSAYLNSPPDSMYLIVDVTIRNNDRKPRAIPPFYLIDEDNREYQISSKGSLIDGVIGVLDSLNPDVEKQGYVIFDVPANRTYRLKVSGGYWSGATAFIALDPNKINLKQ